MRDRKIGILISYINIILNATIGFVYVPLLLFYIGKIEYGLYQLIGSFIAYFGIMDFGLTAAVVRYYTYYKSLNNKIACENVLGLALRAYCCVAILLVGVGSLFYCYLDDIFASSMSLGELEIAKKLFLLLLLNILLTLSTMIFKSIINSHEKFLVLKGTETVQLVLQPILVVLVLEKYPHAIAVAFVQTILNVILILFRIFYCFKYLDVKIKFHYLDNDMLLGFKRLAGWVFVERIVDQIFFKTNQIILGIVAGAASVAVYSISSLIYMNYMALSTAISSVYLPHITEIVAKDCTKETLSSLFIQIGRVQYFLLGLVASGFIIFGKWFIKVWAGDSFTEAYAITLLIIVPFTIDLIQNIGLAILQAQNRYSFRAKVYIIMGAFNLLIGVPLAINYGGVGCAFATGLSMFLGNGLFMNWYYYNVTGIDIGRFWREIGRISLVIAVMTIIGYNLFNTMLSNFNKITFAISILIYSVVYIIVIFCFAMNSEEKNRALSVFKKVGVVK